MWDFWSLVIFGSLNVVVAEIICNRISGRASERGIRRSEVRFLMGTQNFAYCPTLVSRRKTYFPEITESALENLSFTPPKCVYIYEPWWKRIAIQHCVLFRCDLTSTRFVVSLPLPSFSAMWRHIAINLFQRLQKNKFYSYSSTK